jgi:hypothetical protein
MAGQTEMAQRCSRRRRRRLSGISRRPEPNNNIVPGSGTLTDNESMPM